ncbi:HEXXH motif domain-containing protein, partial [Streptomyces sp. SID3343]|uniref:HEXXH motif domain-containing protein n=1 Tax=Streptomyces sp. SID3343 TaxID=2690260 RepID=UPI00136F5468
MSVDVPVSLDGPGPATPPRTVRHTVPRPAFESLLTGGGDVDAVTRLTAAESSRRLLLMRVLLDAVERESPTEGPLPPFTTAWDALVGAGQDPATRLLALPHTGMWAAHVLRRLRGTRPDPAPLWVDLGHLHNLAAAALVLAGRGFRQPVVVREQWVVLPGLGAARLAAGRSWDVAEVEACDGVTHIRYGQDRVAVGEGRSTDNGPAWYPLRHLHAESEHEPITLALEDLVPYRGMRGPTPPEPLTAAQARRWQVMLGQAWDVLVAQDRPAARAMARGLATIVPMAATEPYRPESASSGDGFGSAVASAPDDAVQLASTLVHEFQHIKLSAVLHLWTLHAAEQTKCFYAPWRDDPRPVGGMLQGVYAFHGVAAFWRARRHVAHGAEADLAHFEFALWRTQLHHGLGALRASPYLTDHGRRLVGELRAQVEPWLTEVVPSQVADAATQAIADHRAAWRIRHLSPDAATVDALARAWSARSFRADDHAAPTPREQDAPTLVGDPTAWRLDARAVLYRRRLAQPEGFARLCALDAYGAAEPAEAPA